MSAYSDSLYGLQLRVSITATSVAMGGTMSVNVSEYNALGKTNNVTKSDDWMIQAALSSCPNINIEPFGIALYSGYYTIQNVTQANELRVFPVTACPMLVRYISGYSFVADSDLATVLPGTGSPAPMSAAVDINATYNDVGQSQALQPGMYTVVAADEWGSVAFLYFQIHGAE